jgi:hypothetical protein
MDAPRWRKSSHSGSQSDCVELARTADFAGVRDSKHPGPVLRFPDETLGKFLAKLGTER